VAVDAPGASTDSLAEEVDACTTSPVVVAGFSVDAGLAGGATKGTRSTGGLPVADPPPPAEPVLTVEPGTPAVFAAAFSGSVAEDRIPPVLPLGAGGVPLGFEVVPLGAEGVPLGAETSAERPAAVPC
jgi:hypothetical protein